MNSTNNIASHYAPVLTITGSDSSGGSGIQADIKTIFSLGGYAASAITSVTVQNTMGIMEVFDIPADIVAGQVNAVMDDMCPIAVKLGLMRSPLIVEKVAESIRNHEPKYVVYDPVFVSSSGKELQTPDVAKFAVSMFFPLSTVVTIKLHEASLLLQRPIMNTEDMVSAAHDLMQYGSGSVLVQGGCFADGITTDVLVCKDMADPVFYSSPDIINRNTHGVGCTLSSAIATYLSQGKSIQNAVESARKYINQLIFFSQNVSLGHGSKLLDHARSENSAVASPHQFELFNAFMNAVSASYKQCSDVCYYADKLNVSTRYLAQVTRRIASKSPKTLILEYMAKEIDIQLSSSTKNVQTIAYDFGFKSQAHFTKFFKKMRGVSPREYRTNLRK